MAHDTGQITLNGAQVGYSVHGTGLGKPPLVFAHGYAMRATGELYGFRGMFVREPGELLDLALDAVTLVDADVHRVQKTQNPHFSIDDRPQDVAAPVPLVCGDSDGVVPPERQHDMARKLPRSKEVVFSGKGHMLANERPAVAAREILTFLDSDKEWIADAPQGRS